MRTARATRQDQAPEQQWVAGRAPPPPLDPLRRWVAPNAPTEATGELEPAAEPSAAEPAEGGTAEAPAPVVDPAAAAPASVDTAGEGILRPDEVAAPRGATARPTGSGRRVLGIPWPPPLASLLAVAVVALLAFGLGAVVGGRPGLEAGTTAEDTRAGLAAGGPTDSVPVAARTTAPAGRAPAACLDTARFGDETISLLTANIRDRRLDDALLRYAAASRACRQAADGP